MAISAQLRDLQNASPQQWLDRASRSVPQVLCIVLVVAIAWQLVQLTWMLLDSRTPAETPAIAPPPATTTVQRGIDIQSIVNAHLFGVPQAQAQADPSQVAPTTMNLVLTAVFASSDPSKGLAIIGESAQGGKVYSVGGTVRPGTRLHAVYVDRVILDRNGQQEALLLPKPNMAAMNIARPPAPPVSSQFNENLRRLAESNPGAFAEVVRPQPVFANGVQRGYRVYPGRNRQQFAKLGLQPGDLILSINGTPLDDPQRGMEIFNTMGSSDRVSVTIERNGQSQELTLNTAQITLPDANAEVPTRRSPGAPNPRQTFTPPDE